MDSTQPRIVVVTGAAAGIGLATARAFAAAGDIVVLTDRNEPEVMRCAAGLGQPHCGMVLDVTDENSVTKTFAAVQRSFGRLDILINNAGIVDPEARDALSADIETVRRVFAVNTSGSFLAAREAGRIMLAQGSGAIVNVSSGAALAALARRAAYSASKAAILGFTRSLACEWAGSGVRVNAVLPGYVSTEILLELERSGRFDPTQVSKAIPLGRLATPAEIAAVIVEAANARYMTGAQLVVDGGVAAFGGSGAASAAPAPTARLDGAVVITGGGSGIGEAIADLYVAAGRKVAIIDRDSAALNRFSDDRLTVAADVSDVSQVNEAIAKIVSTLGPISVLVNNAGAVDRMAPTLDQTRQDFDQVMETNLIGAFIVAQAVGTEMVKAGQGGAIVNLSSIAASGGIPQRNAYCGAKAGVTALTRNLACEWARYGIRVNAVAPGYISTPGIRAVEASGERDFSEVRRRIPMGRLGEPDEIAEVFDFLSSPAAAYVTGAIYAVDGGYSAFGAVGAAS